MDSKSYRVRDGANLGAFPRGTKVGDTVEMTESEALYECDMGRIEPVGGDPIPGETPGHPVDAATGEPLVLDEATRAALAAAPIGEAGASTEMALGVAQAPAEGVQIGTGTHPDGAEPLPETMPEADRAEPGADPIAKPRRER